MFQEERKRTAIILKNTPSQDLIVFGTLDMNFQKYLQLEFLVMNKHVCAMYNFLEMMTHAYNTPPTMISLYYQR